MQDAVPPEVRQFRNELTPKVPSWYSAGLHYFGTTAVSLPLIVYGLIRLSQTGEGMSLGAREGLMIPGFLFLASLVEYITHRVPLHRRIRLLSKAFDVHTLMHHSYFTDRAIEAETGHDFYRVLFPVWGVVLIQYLVNVPVSLVAGWIWGERIGFIGLMVGVGFFFLYETIHALCHFSKSSNLFRIPGLLFLREHHRIHHHKGSMSRANFNIVFPFWDWILGTARQK